MIERELLRLQNQFMQPMGKRYNRPIMEVQFAVAKISKYATQESGDTLEMIERPSGGLSFVLVDGQRSGRSAKIISNMATTLIPRNTNILILD